MVNRIILVLGIIVLITGIGLYYYAGTITDDPTAGELIKKGLKTWALFVMAGGTVVIIIGLVKKG